MTMIISQLGLKQNVLKSDTVIVTGAGGGIGYEAARALLSLGANVVIAEVNQQNGRMAEVALEKEFGKDRVLFVATDVGDEASVRNLYNLAILAFGKVDAVINNATIAVLGKVVDVPIEEWDRSYHVNLRGPVLMAKTCLPDMLKRRQGHIINMASVAGLVASPLIATYAASKHGVRAFTDALRREVRPFGIRVSGIYPGPAATEFGKKLERTRSRERVKKLKYPHLTSKYVAQRVVDVAKRPRRSLVIPWWFRIITTFDMLFPVVVDWILYLYSRKNHQLD